MPYQNQDRRRQAERERQKRHRKGVTPDTIKGVTKTTEGVTDLGRDMKGVTDETGTLSDEEIKDILQYWIDYHREMGHE